MENVTTDRQSADLLDVSESIDGVEGEEISLTVYFTKNGPLFVGLEFDIELSGPATGIYNVCAGSYSLYLLPFLIS